MNKRWVEKYRPTNTDDYVFPADKVLKNILADKFKIDPSDVLMQKGSDITNVASINKLIHPFITTIPYNSKFKLLHIDEANHFNKVAKTEIKSILGESVGVVVILTTNNIENFDDAIQSRCTVIEIKQSKENFISLAERILTAENIEYDKEQLSNMIKNNQINLRSMLNTLQNKYDRK